jgi:hypothetical protein
VRQLLSTGPNFVNVTTQAGILTTPSSQPFAVAWVDVNGDGLPDLWVDRQGKGTPSDQPPNLYINQGNGTFVDQLNQYVSKIQLFDAHGAVWADFTNSGLPSLYQTVGAHHGMGQGDKPFYVNVGGQLINEASAVGLSDPLARGRDAAVFDYNNSGLLSLMLTNGHRPDGQAPSQLFAQTATGFQDVTANAGLSGLSTTEGAFSVVGDINGGGPIGLIYNQIDGPPLYYTLQNGVFTQVPNFLPPDEQISDVAVADFNNDGYQDVFIVTKSISMSSVEQFSPTQIAAVLDGASTDQGFTFQNGGTLTVQLQTNAGGVGPGQVFIGSSGYSPTKKTFTLDPNNTANDGIMAHSSGKGGGTYIGYDPTTQTWTMESSDSSIVNQGLVVNSTTAMSNLTNIGFDPSKEMTHNYLMIFNPQTGQLVNETQQAGLGGLYQTSSVVAGDFTNDMHNDLILTQENRVAGFPTLYFHNNGDGTFTQMNVFPGQPSGPVGPAYPSFGIGQKAITADYMGNGMLDLFVGGATYHAGSPEVVYPGVPNILWQNQPNGNDWLEVHLQGTVSNRDGVGAIVSVTAGGVTQVQEETDGTHRYSQNSNVLHFGLAQNTTVTKVVIQWPSGVTQEFDNVSANQILQAVEPGGHTMATARAIPLWLSVGPYTGQVGSSNAADYYRFAAAATGNLRIDLFNLTANANVELLDSNGNVLAQSSSGGSSKEVLAAVTGGTTYYLAVLADTTGATTNYSMRLSDESTTDTQGPATVVVKIDGIYHGTVKTPAPPTISAWIDDTGLGGSKIVAAEYFVDFVGAPGTGTPMIPTEGQFSGSIEYVSATMNATTYNKLGAGTHQIYVRGEDAAGNWGLTFEAPFVKQKVLSFSIGAPSSVTAGTPFFINVSAVDSKGGTVNGYAGTVTFSSSDSQAGLPANYTFVPADGGTHTFWVTLQSTGSQSITITDVNAGTITGSATITVNGSVPPPRSSRGSGRSNTAGDPDLAAFPLAFGVTTTPGATVGTAFPITLTPGNALSGSPAEGMHRFPVNLGGDWTMAGMDPATVTANAGGGTSPLRDGVAPAVDALSPAGVDAFFAQDAPRRHDDLDWAG